MNKDYYKILGLSSKASGEEIKKAYHRLAKIYHPDSNGGNLEAAEVFKEVNEAYHILSDHNKKAAYDLHSSTGYVIQRTDFQPYFIASIDSKTVKLNEEFEITYRYLGEGRVFKKPMISSIFYNSSPVVNHRIVHTDNGEAKEISMTFTISALTTGTITIPPASIYINHKFLQSEPLTVMATGNDCYFKKGEEASSHPYILYMHKEQTGKTLYRRTYIYRHAVLIPRSHYAYYYHQIGATMKIAFTILCALYFISINNSVLAGFFVGSLLGGIACNSMYKITGIRSKFYHTLQYATARTYFEEEYKPGREVGYWIFDDKAFYIFLSLFR